MAGAEPDVDVSADGTVAEIDLPYAGTADGATARRGLDLLRDDLVPATVGRVGAEAVVGGDTAFDRDFNDQLAQRLPIVFGFVLLLTLGLLLLTFRSLVVALTAIGLNVLSVLAAYGLLVLVFQHSWAGGLLGFESSGAIVAWLPLFLFVILFGLSMDYHVFVLSRIREGVDRGMTTEDAVSWGIRSSAGVVTSAALVMMGVFAIFATLTTLDMKQLGVGLAAAVLIDATIVARRAAARDDAGARRPQLVPAARAALAAHRRARGAGRRAVGRLGRLSRPRSGPRRPPTRWVARPRAAASRSARYRVAPRPGRASSARPAAPHARRAATRPSAGARRRAASPGPRTPAPS